MMKLAICLNVFLVFQIFHIAESTVEDKIKSYDLYVYNNIEEVQQIFDEFYSKATSIANYLQISAVTTEESIFTALKNIFNDFDAQVNKLKRTNANINESDCKGIANDCKSDFLEVLTNSSDCLTEKLDEVASQIDNMHFIYDKIVEQSKSFKTGIKICLSDKNKAEHLKCIEELIKKTSGMTTDQLKEYIERVYQKFKDFEPAIKKCYAQDSIDSIKKKIPVLLKDFEKCIKGS